MVDSVKAARSGAERPRHVVIAGGGRVGRAVAARLPEGWSIVVIDRDASAEAEVQVARPEARFVLGDATSRLTLSRCGLDGRSVLVAATDSDEVNHETARVARVHFGVDERVIVTTETPGPGSTDFDIAECVRPADAVAGRVVNRVSIEASRAVDIGLGIGEILQVTVLEGSPAAGRALRDFGARHWLVAAVYRGDKLIVPHGDTRVLAGDRALLVGEPSDLQDVAPYFRGGAPVFPAQYGASLAWCGGEGEFAAATKLAANLETNGVLAVATDRVERARTAPVDWRAWLDEQSVGCLLLPAQPLPWYALTGLVQSRRHAAITEGRRPVVISRGFAEPVQRVLACIRDARAQREVLLAGIDLARQLDAKLEVLAVEGAGATVATDVERVARLYGIELNFRVAKGNPVACIRSAAAAEGGIAVVGIRPEHNGPLSPDVSTYLLHFMPVTTVFVPWSQPG